MTRTVVRLLGLLSGALLVSCGEEAGTPAPAPGGDAAAPPPAVRSSTTVDDLLDPWSRVVAVDGALATLAVPGTLTVPDPPELAGGMEGRVFGVPTLPFPSSLRVRADDAELEPAATLAHARQAPSYLPIPARRRWQAEDSASTGVDLPMAFVAGEPARVRLAPGQELENRLEMLADDAVVRIRAKAEGTEAVRLHLGFRDRALGTFTVPPGEWTTLELPIPRPGRIEVVVLTLDAAATGDVVVDWWEVETGGPDLVFVTHAEDRAVGLEYRPAPPPPELDLLPAWRRLGDAYAWFAGGASRLEIEGEVSGLRVGATTFTAADLAAGAVVLPPLAGLQKLVVEGTPTRLRLHQPEARLLPAAMDPVLRWNDFTLEDREGTPCPREVARRVRARMDCGHDRRGAFWLPAPSAVSLDLELPAGAELRYAVGAHRPDLGEDGTPLTFRTTWRREDGAETVLDEATWDPHAFSWQERRVPITAALAGRGTLRFAAAGEGPLADLAAVAMPRVVLPEAPAARRPNLLVYLVDTLRADGLGCYGADNRTPRLDAFAEESYQFDQFYAVASWTRPSTATLMSGIFPVYHGAVQRDAPLPDGVVTLAEDLRASGYATWAAIQNVQVYARGLNFEQGFGRFVTAEGFRYLTEPTLSSLHLNDTIFPWLETWGDEPFFLYVHSTDPHSPYQAPAPFDATIAPYQGTLDPLPLQPRSEMPADAAVTAEDVRYLRALYDGAIRFQDREFGRLLDELDRLGLAEDTIVVLLSDHGEEFHEHGGWEHGGRMWNELLHVPFLVRVPERWRDGLVPPTRLADRYHHADVLPGLLDLMGLDVLGPCQGESFLPTLQGRHVERPLLFQDRDAVGALLQGTHKLIWMKPRLADEPQLELYDEATDHAERHDLAAEDPETREGMLRLRERLLKTLDRTGHFEADDTALSEADLREIGALGYGNDSTKDGGK